MTCKIKNCHNQELSGFDYCQEHLCCKRKKNGLMCKKTKFKKYDVCFSHLIFYENIAIYLWIIGIVIGLILGVIFAVFGPKFYYIFFGKLIIIPDFDNVIMREGTPAVKIEVLNRLGYPLLNVSGAATLECQGVNKQIQSKTFGLEGGHTILSDGGDAKFLLSPDPFFVDLIKTSHHPCSDAFIQFAEYKKTNESHAELLKVASFDIFENNLTIVNTSYDNYNYKINYQCLSCYVIIKIYSKNNKIFYKNVSHKFIGGSSHVQFDRILPTLNTTSSNFVVAYMHRFSDFKPCIGMSSDDCGNLLCKKIKQQYNLGVKCEELVSSIGFATPLFTDANIKIREC